MVKQVIIKSSLILFLITMLIFGIVQILFRTQEYFQISDFQYLLATSVSNAFIITSIYAIVAAYNMLTQTKKQQLSFFKVFGLCFSPGVIAGFLSLAVIFLIFNNYFPEGVEQLKNEYLDYSLLQYKNEASYEEAAKIINSDAVRNTNILNSRTFILASLIIVFFNFSLGLMMAFLWKVKTTPTKR
ncbi:DUF4199 family protein [Weeksellaceae bacterium TAE3-ERU29]|nr:DUF4199 family protein [Weeksellaceae bacterium TAE3-ERU29]